MSVLNVVPRKMMQVGDFYRKILEVTALMRHRFKFPYIIIFLFSLSWLSLDGLFVLDHLIQKAEQMQRPRYFNSQLRIQMM